MSDAPVSTSQGNFIYEDRACTSCGYNLKGLHVGGPCPECGQTISLARRSGGSGREGMLGQAPKQYIYTLMLGLTLMGLSIASSPLVLLIASQHLSGPELMIVQLALAAGWVGGGLIVLRPRALPKQDLKQSARRPEWRALRLSVVATQSMWLMVPIAAFLSQKLGARAFDWLSVACALIGVAGWPLVAWHLSFLADWASDTPLANRLRGSGWTLAVGSLVFALVWVMGWFGPGVAAFISFIAVSVRVLWVLALLFFVFSIFQMALMVHWARANQLEAEARDRRLTERARRERAAAEARIAAIDDASDPESMRLLESIERAQDKMRFVEAEGPVPLAGSNMPQVEESDDADPYELEDS